MAFIKDIRAKLGLAKDPANDAAKARVRGGVLSGLTAQILTLNIIGLAILVGGILYFNQFRTGLVETRLAGLVLDAELLAGAIGESATGGADAKTVNVDVANSILQRLTSGHENRARLFGVDGALQLDSRNLIPTSQVIMEELAPPGESPGISQRWDSFKAWFIDLLLSDPEYAVYEERLDQIASDYDEVLKALEGTRATNTRVTDANTLMLTVAIPVKRFHRVLGALLVSVETTEIEEVVRQERLAILEVFGVALIVTAFLSLVLAGTIARPVRRLADFAYQVRQGRGREVKMPDFSNRRDELGELSRALRDMTAALYMRIDAIEAFASDVAHELKNPLTSLHSAVETLERTQQDDQRAQLLKIIKEDVVRLDRLISDISNASRLDAELLRSEMEIIDVHNMLETIISIYAAVDMEDTPTIELISDDQPLAVTGIKEHLAQVIRNLIDNARSFNPPGELIQLIATKNHDKVVIRVEDRGPGISDDKLEVIFDRFYTERPDSGQKDSHSGLGLNICQQIIAVHGGEVWAENVYVDIDGKRTCTGARFTISLPSAGLEGV